MGCSVSAETPSARTSAAAPASSPPAAASSSPSAAGAETVGTSSSVAVTDVASPQSEVKHSDMASPTPSLSPSPTLEVLPDDIKQKSPLFEIVSKQMAQEHDSRTRSLKMKTLVKMVYEFEKLKKNHTHDVDLESASKLHAAPNAAITPPPPVVYRVVLTGGPCGGKTSSLDHFTARLTKAGVDVYCAPEVPTILINGGCRYPGPDGGHRLTAFEMALLRLQIQVEETFYHIACSTGSPSVVVYDRALMDVAAYLPQDMWQQILSENKWSEQEFLSRYDMVLHLVTAADGAEKYYTTANNNARRESAEQARALDQKVKDCWRNHKRHSVIDNSTDFMGKLNRATSAVLDLFGLDLHAVEEHAASEHHGNVVKAGLDAQ